MRPYVEPYLNRLELVNETMTLFAAYSLFEFTEFVFNMESRIMTGWSLITCIVFCLLLNVTLLIIQACKKLKLSIKRRFVRARIAK